MKIVQLTEFDLIDCIEISDEELPAVIKEEVVSSLDCYINGYQYLKSISGKYYRKLTFEETQEYEEEKKNKQFATALTIPEGKITF